MKKIFALGFLAISSLALMTWAQTPGRQYTSANVIALWSGTCNSTSALFGNGACQAVTSLVTPTLSSSAITALAIATAPSTSTIATISSLTFPSSGGPWRASAAYQLPLTFTLSVTNVDCWVSDGTNKFVSMSTANSNGAAGGHTSGNAAGWSTVTYTNSQVVTFTLVCEGNAAGADSLASGPSSGVAAALQILPVQAN